MSIWLRRPNKNNNEMKKNIISFCLFAVVTVAFISYTVNHANVPYVTWLIYEAWRMQILILLRNFKENMSKF